MPTIKVDFGKLSQLESQLSRVPGVISSAASSVSSVRSGLDWDVACEASIDRKLRDIANALKDSQSRMQKTAQFVGDAVQQYQKAENGVDDQMPYGGGGGGGSRNNSISSSDKKQENARTLLESFGSLGEGLALVTEPVANWLHRGEFVFGDEDDSTLMKWFKGAKAVAKGGGIISAINELGKKTSNIARFKNYGKQYTLGSQHADYFAENILGLNKFNKKVAQNALGDNALIAKGWKWAGGNFVEGFKTNIKNTFVKSNGKLNKFGIAGVVLDLGINGYENYEEYKTGSISGDRAVVETIAETAGNIALTAAATAAVGAAVVAAGASVPVLAVSLAAGAVVMGVNAIVEGFTGKELTEHIGDFFGDTWDNGKKAVSAISSAGKKIAEKTKAFLSFSTWKPAWI